MLHVDNVHGIFVLDTSLIECKPSKKAEFND